MTFFATSDIEIGNSDTNAMIWGRLPQVILMRVARSVGNLYE